MKPISERAKQAWTTTCTAAGGAGGLGSWAAAARYWWPPSRGCVAVALLAATAAVIVMLTADAGTAPNGMLTAEPNEMPASLFFDDDAHKQKFPNGLEDLSPSNLTADHLLDGLLTPEFRYGSCRSRYEFAGYHKESSHKPSPYLIAKLRKQEALQKRCGPGTAPHKRALQRLKSGEGVATSDADNNDGDDCRYLVNISYRGLGNRMLAVASAFLYAVLTDRVLLVDGGKEDVADLFCEPFPGTTWLLPRGGWWTRLKSFDKETKESLGNMLQRNGSRTAVVVSADGRNVSWSSTRTPPYVYLHLDGGYGYHDKLFFCGAHQRLLRSVPWLLMRTDSYIVPGLFLIPQFRAGLESMFPEKDAVFYHIGRYLFHPSNAVWHAVTSYYRSILAVAAGPRVGIQIRVFHGKQPRQVVLDQVLSCIRDEGLLPEAAETTANASILVTSLSSWYFQRIKDEYGSRVSTGGVHQPSHEGQQRWDDVAHDMRALSEMYLLSMCDVLITSGISTFGYVAQGLAGLRPWVMARPSMWAKDWRDELDPNEPPCRRMISVEPCFHSPSAYDCETRKYVELDKVRPYIKRCMDVKWGIKLVNESNMQW